MKKLVSGLVLSLALVVLSGTANAGKKDIVDTAVGAESFNTLVAAVKAAGLVETLKGAGPFTVFAPTDEAFQKLPAGTVENLLKPENKDQLIAVLTYHVVPGNVMAKQVVGLNGATTVNGQQVDISTADGVKVDDANVVKTDIECSNGVIHIIDSVILPESRSIVGVAAEAGTFNTLVAAAKAAGLASVLDEQGPFTVFAPTDDAFAKLPAGTVESLLKPENKHKLANILKYHVVSGRVYSSAALKVKHTPTLQGSQISIGVDEGQAMINTAKLIKTDIDASNGVIHVIDSVLIPAHDGKKIEQTVSKVPAATKTKCQSSK